MGEIRRARRVEEYRLLASLNIPNVGPNIAKKLLAGRSLEELRQMSAEELARLEAVGPERSAAIVREFAAQKEYLDELVAAVETIHPPAAGSRGRVCFTGKMPEKRAFYEERARRAGFEPADSVTRDLALLVAADASGAGGKLESARRNGIKIISPEEFLRLTETAAEPPAAEPEEDLFSGWNG